MSEPAADSVRASLRTLSELANRVADTLGDEVAEVAERVIAALGEGRRLFFCGNGGSAADAQHMAAEYVVRFRRDRPGLPAMALTTDTSILTAAGNDYGFQDVFRRQVEALGGPGDVLFLHSTSGMSENLLRAADAGRERGMITVGLLARDGGSLRGRVDHAIVVPTEVTSHAQEIHLAIGHAICDLVDRAFASATEPSET